MSPPDIRITAHRAPGPPSEPVNGRTSVGEPSGSVLVGIEVGRTSSGMVEAVAVVVVTAVGAVGAVVVVAGAVVVVTTGAVGAPGPPSEPVNGRTSVGEPSGSVLVGIEVGRTSSGMVEAVAVVVVTAVGAVVVVAGAVVVVGLTQRSCESLTENDQPIDPSRSSCAITVTL